MINNFMNNPMFDMFKKTFENPMDMFGNNVDASNAFNPTKWIEMSNKMMKNIPWLEGVCSQSDYDRMKEICSDLGHLSFENTQAMMHKQSEIIQKHSAELHKFIQNMSSSSDVEANMEAQKEFMQLSFESMINDFKELTEMYSKSNLETLSAVSDKISKHMSKCGNKKESSCSSHHTKPKSSSTKPSHSTRKES